jgi:D-serine deaminase-like pyridoxal phosphate-dependent protein
MPYEPHPGMGVEELDTPALIVDLDILERNIAKMAGFFADRPAALRPHSKTHKTPAIAHMQLEAGAIGMTCAKVGEAEAMADGGIRDILIANQVIGRVKIDRLTDLARRADVMVAVDDARNVVELSQAASVKGVTLQVLVEVDIGMRRCGVPPGDPALELARRVAASPGLRLAGLMSYEGHLVLIPDPKERRTKVLAALEPLADTVDLLRRHGLPVEIVSGGATGSYDVTGSHPVMTEIQAGSYVFMDTTYGAVRPEFEVSLTVLSTVVSRPCPDYIVTDAGLKALTRDFDWPELLDVPGAGVRYLSEEHGVIDLANPQAVHLRPGDKVSFISDHCCTTINLYDRLHAVRRGVVEAIWPITGRGKSQ